MSVSNWFLRSVLAAAVSLPAAALAARSGWSEADESQLRLLLIPAGDGHIEGGIEIVLEPGWYTYWANPGDAGVPPVFSFEGSENVAKVEVRYPSPVRYDDGASVSLIYRDEVVFPLSVTPIDPGEPVTLRVDAKFGVCSSICVPTGATSEVTLAPDAAADPLSNARIREFTNRLPKGPEPGRFEVMDVMPEGDFLAIRVRMPDSAYLDLFAEPPEGWYVGQPALADRVDGISTYRLSLAGRPAGADLNGQKFRFVAVSGGEAIEQSVEIH